MLQALLSIKIMCIKNTIPGFIINGFPVKIIGGTSIHLGKQPQHCTTTNPEPRSLKFFSQKYYTSLWSNFRPHYLQTIGAVLKFSLSKNFIRLGISSRIFFLVFFEILSTHLRTTHATDQSHLEDFILSNMLNYYHILFDLKLCNKLVKFF